MNGKARRGGAMRLAAMVMGLAVLFTGCTRDGGGDEPSPTASSSEEDPANSVDQSRTFRAKVHAEGTGAAVFTWDGEQEIVLTRVGNSSLDVNLLSAGFKDPEIVTSDPSLRFRWAFDLLNGYEDKPGTFQITSEAVNAQGLKNQAFLIWMKVKDPSKEVVYEMEEVEFLKEFREIKEPCTVVVGENESTGSLTCPSLASAEGEVAGITVTWEEIAA